MNDRKYLNAILTYLVDYSVVADNDLSDAR
jgi:hypothetical protein